MTVGLALLEAVGIDAEDVGLVQTIGLLSNHFGALAGPALAMLPDGAAPALLWLADRVAGWGRVSVVRSLAGIDDPEVRTWLVRRAVDGDILNGYFVGSVIQNGQTSRGSRRALGGSRVHGHGRADPLRHDPEPGHGSPLNDE